MATKTRANDRQPGGTHYGGGKFQHWDLCAKNRIGYLESCASKYISRWPKKGGVLDCEKAIHYIDKIMDCVEDYGYAPTGSAPYDDLRLFFGENSITDRDEQLAITYLLTWDSVTMIALAKSHAEQVLEKARALAA
jgi:hypothetical protein